jgi:hypothetical protein
LRDALRLLRFTSPDEELRAQSFGPGTRRAVEEFQRAGLSADGLVDRATADA